MGDIQTLDPVNSGLMKKMIGDMREQGKVEILSTHRMNDVEELCDRALMLDHGSPALYGSLPVVEARYHGNSVLLKAEGDPGDLRGVSERRAHKAGVELTLDGTTTLQKLLERLVARIYLLMYGRKPQLVEVISSLRG